MRYFRPLFTALALLVPFGAFAHDGVMVHDAYARLSNNSAAIFLQIDSHEDVDDTLVSASSDAAAMTHLQTHHEDANGVMQMLDVPEGFAIPALIGHDLGRGGDHIMLMGLTRTLTDGDHFTLILTFRRAGLVEVDVVVDNARGQ